MSQFDLAGVGIFVALGTFISALGIGIDSLLLNRHSSRLNTFSIKWWVFFDNLRILDLPRIAVTFYLKLKNIILGDRFNISFFFRSFILSILLTFITIPGGRSLGLALTIKCNLRTGWGDKDFSLLQYLTIGWNWTGYEAIVYLGPINLMFDLATIFVTVLLLSFAVKKTDYFLILLIALDIIACIILMHNIIYLSDQFDTATSISNASGYLFILPGLINSINESGCGAYHVVTSKLLFASTILLPTLIYLIMIVILFVMRESFKLLKYFTMHILEKSSEDKKTLFAHLGVSLGLSVSLFKMIQEVSKLIL